MMKPRQLDDPMVSFHRVCKALFGKAFITHRKLKNTLFQISHKRDERLIKSNG